MRNSIKFDAVVAGYICIDLIPDFKKSGMNNSISEIFIPGRLIEIDGLSFCLGGVVANTGLAMKKFEKKVFLNGLIGDDFIGKIILENFDKYELSEGLKTTNQSGTAFSIVVAPPGIDRIFLESTGCNAIFDESCINFNAVSQSRLFHFGYPPLLKQFYLNNGEQLFMVFSDIQKMGVVTSLDFSLPDPSGESGKVNWSGILEKVLPFTDIFVPSLEEAMQIVMPEEYAEIQKESFNSDIIDKIPIEIIRKLGKRIIGWGVKIVLIKASHWGTYLLTGDVTDLNEKRGLHLSGKKWNHRELWCNAHTADPAKIKSTTGTGDTAVASFLSAILDGENPENSVKFASIAGRNKLYVNNIVEELPGWADMVRDIKMCPDELICFDSKNSEF